MINPNNGSLREALAIVFAQLLIMHCLFAGEPVTSDSLGIVDSLRPAEALFQAGEYRRAEELFRAELAIPEIPVRGGCPVGWTPKSVRVRIWLARCQGRRGQKEVALKECIQLAREAKEKWEWWNKEDRERLAKTLVENAQTPEQSIEIERFAKTQGFKELQEYFDAISLVKNGDAAGVVKYLTRNDVPICIVDPALWSDEIAESAAALKPAMIRYVREQLERAARWQDMDFSLYHLDHLLRVLPDQSFVEPCLGSRQLERRFPDDYRRWRNMLQIYPQECKKTAILHLKGDRDSKELALDLINSLQLYDREILDQIAVAALEDCYPIQIRSLLAFWRVSGQQFGLEAETTDLALQQASDDARRTALSQAVEWWKRQRAGLADAAQVPVLTTNLDVLEKGLRCRVEMIRSEAIHQLGKSKQAIGNTQNKALVKLRGIVIHKDWTKSTESWNAGGSEYYVLKVVDKDMPSDKRTAKEGVILRPSTAIPFERFANFAGKNVVCEGEFIAGEPYIPPHDHADPSPLPIENPITGKTDNPIRGSGFQVHRIDPTEEK